MPISVTFDVRCGRWRASRGFLPQGRGAAYFGVKESRLLSDSRLSARLSFVCETIRGRCVRDLSLLGGVCARAPRAALGQRYPC